MSELKFLKDKSKGVFVNNGKLKKPLETLVNENGIFEYDTQLEPLDAPSVEKCSVPSPGASTAAGNLKGKWVVLYGIEVYAPYGTD